MQRMTGDAVSSGWRRVTRIAGLAVLGGLLGLGGGEPIPHPARAAGAPVDNPCADPQTQAAINACAAQQYREADARLNAAYRALMERLTGERRARLKAVQRAWVTFREAHCTFVAGPYAGGTLQPSVHAGCMTETARARAAELRQILEDLAGR